MNAHRPAGNLRRGLRGSLDLPIAVISNPARVDVGGWVYHEHAEVLLVVVMADGRVVGSASRDIARPDVAGAHPAASSHAGWSTTVGLGQVGAQVRLSAHALVAAPASGGQPARRVLVPFVEQVLDVRGRGVVSGEVDLPDEVAPGTLRVSGTADVLPALAHVEVSLGGSEPVRARHSLPSEPDPAGGAEGLVRGFSALVQVPSDARHVDVRVTAVATDGTRGQLPTAPVPVVAPEDDSSGEERDRVQRERFDHHVAGLRSAFPRTSRPRVLVAAHDLGTGGAQGYLDDLMQGLHEQGIEMCVVASAAGPLLDRIESAYGAPVLVVGGVPSDSELLEAQVRLVAGFALEHGAAACLANTLVTFPAVLAATRLGLPTTWAIHESFSPAVFWHEYLRAQADSAVLGGTLEALRSADEVMFVAESTRRMYDDLVRPEASSLVPYGLDLPALEQELAATSREQARGDLDIPDDHRVLVCVGSVEPRKGQLALVRAFLRLGPARGRTSLYIVGATDTAYSRVLRDFVHDAGLDESVHVVDSDPDVMRWYVAADALVSAADVESMPRTMLEAMLAGRPVAAVSVFGVPELVDDGTSGWLCEPGDLHALTGLLEQVVTAEPGELDRRGRAARERVLAEHSATGYVDHVVAWARAGLGAEAAGS